MDKVKQNYYEMEMERQKFLNNCSGNNIIQNSSCNSTNEIEAYLTDGSNKSSKSSFTKTDKANTIIFKEKIKQIPTEYINDIFSNLKQEELEAISQKTDSVTQTDITEKMRAILIDWIIQVHLQFKLKPETLFLAVGLIDKFLLKRLVLKSKFQLLGVACLLIACKYEEIYYPNISDFATVTNNTFSNSEILIMEAEILNVLEYNITIPSSLQFFEIMCVNFNFNFQEYYYGLYLIESFLVDWRHNDYLPSTIALAATYLIMKLKSYDNYSVLYQLLNENYQNKDILKESARNLYFFVENSKVLQYKAVFNKYKVDDYLNVAEKGLNQ